MAKRQKNPHDPSLEELTDRARTHHAQVLAMSREATQCQKNAVHHAVDAGIVLLWAKRRLAWYRKNKKKLPGGMPAPKWMDWLKENFDGSQSTASVYMRLARKWKTYQWIVNSPNVSIRQLVALMTTKKGDEPAGARPGAGAGDRRGRSGKAWPRHEGGTRAGR